jgi:potassium-dependent mechanosensitive channel
MERTTNNLVTLFLASRIETLPGKLCRQVVPTADPFLEAPVTGYNKRIHKCLNCKIIADGITRYGPSHTAQVNGITICNLARIPLIVFAFLGGALAIGVGFGTQTIIKNFISGVLILLERKVKVGDTVDVDGALGRVTSVDLRASTILGFDGVETVIPNSTFLENKVTNWTHNNSRIRRIMRVGVAYGSRTDLVRDILAGCAERHGLVLKEPQPLVFFEDFGDNAMIFALYFWIDYGPEVNPLRVASDLRFMIEQRFTEESIAVACPQRDVHLDSEQPLRVEVVSSSGPAGCI